MDLEIIFDSIGRKVLLKQLKLKQPSSLSNAIENNIAPATWALVVRHLSSKTEDRLEVPDSLFNYKPLIPDSEAL